jgi:hypothetical protein
LFLSASLNLIGSSYSYYLIDEAAKVSKGPSTINKETTVSSLCQRANLWIPARLTCFKAFGNVKLTSNRRLVTANGYLHPAMSLPPATIKIKRKIGEDPVEYFRRSLFSSVAEKVLNLHNRDSS